MTVAILLALAMAKLTREGHGDLVRLLRHSADRGELCSCLREYVPDLRGDAKVDAWLFECQHEQLHLLELCSEEKFGHDAVERAIQTGNTSEQRQITCGAPPSRRVGALRCQHQYTGRPWFDDSEPPAG